MISCDIEMTKLRIFNILCARAYTEIYLWGGGVLDIDISHTSLDSLKVQDRELVLDLAKYLFSRVEGFNHATSQNIVFRQ